MTDLTLLSKQQSPIARPSKLNNASAPQCLEKSALLELVKGFRAEEQRSTETLHLTAYENRLSKFAHSFLSTPLSFRQHEGTLYDHKSDEEVIRHGPFTFMGLPGLYAFEQQACEAARQLFHATVSDFRPTSGLHGLLCTIGAITKPGDIVYTIDPLNGGHSASRQMLTMLGRQSEYIPWSNTELSVDLDALADAIKKRPPQAIILEHGTPLFSLPLWDIRAIVGERVAMVYDGSHTLGLIAGERFQDPLREGCDVLQGNLHKTFPGPQKALINFKTREQGLAVSASISKAFISNQHAHHAMAAYITMLEMQAFAKEYASQMVVNAKTLATTLSRYGFELVSRNGDFTNSHQVLIRGKYVDDWCPLLFACGISTNARDAFGHRVIRIGVQEITRRGMKKEEMKRIAMFLRDALLKRHDTERVKRDVVAFNTSFRDIHYSFDEIMGYNNAL